MRKTAIALLALGLVVASSAYASNAVRISQVYGGGGGGTSNTYKYDYVELFNSSGLPVDISGWALEYGSATGSSFGSSTYNVALIPAGQTIPACGYYLVRCGSAGSGGADLPVVADFNSPAPNVSGTTGKFVLLTAYTVNYLCANYVATGDPLSVDLIGWATANCFEGTLGPTTDGAHALVRGGDGLNDTDNNAADFTSVIQPVTIHNSASPTNPGCTIVPASGTTWGRIKTLYK